MVICKHNIYMCLVQFQDTNMCYNDECNESMIFSKILLNKFSQVVV